MSNRFKVTTVHGESGTVYHVVDTQATESEQHAIVASYSTAKYASKAHKAACMARDVRNEREQRNDDELAKVVKRNSQELTDAEYRLEQQGFAVDR